MFSANVNAGIVSKTIDVSAQEPAVKTGVPPISVVPIKVPSMV